MTIACGLSFEGAYAQQKIKGFHLSNYKDTGTNDWEVKGKEATMQDNMVNIDKMEANYGTDKDAISITSEKAKLNKDNMDVYLKDNVQIHNKDGSTMLTDSLKWQRGTGQIETNDWVRAKNDSMQIKAKGLSGDAGQKKVDFEKNIEMMVADKKGGSIKITCLGPLEFAYEKGVGTFNNNVEVESKDGKLFADKATAYFDSKEKRMTRIVCEGNVRIVREDNITMADKATYLGDEKRIVLEGNPRLFYFPKEKEQ